MRYHADFKSFYPGQRSPGFHFNSYRKKVLTLSACFIGLLSVDSSAQPLAQGKAKFLGCATNYSISRYLERYFNQVTPGNDGKWGSVETYRGQYDWTNLDKIYNYTLKRAFPFREHVLVWGNQQPSWIAALDSADQRAAVEKWIRLVGERYPLMSYTEVVNEPFNGVPIYKNALGGDGKTGWDWVITAFELARRYCSTNAKLILNEYNVLHSNAVTTNYINIINLLKDRGLIDGIGVQGHYFEFRSHMDATSNTYVWDINTIKSNLDRLAAVGLPIYITEFDIDESNDANQLSQYKVYFPIFWNHPAVKGITLWGYIQDDIWTSHPNTYLLLWNGTERPALQWMRTYILSPPAPSPISPDAAAGVPRDPVLVWHSSASATSYRVQVAANSVFASVTVDTTVVDTLLQLSPLAANSRFYWRMSAANEHGTSEYSVTASYITGDQITAVDGVGVKPTAFQLYQNHPNPFNPATSIDYSIAGESFVQLRIYDLLGREIKTLVNQKMPAGKHTVRLDADGLISGIYIYKIKAGDFEKVKRMIVIK